MTTDPFTTAARAEAEKCADLAAAPEDFEYGLIVRDFMAGAVWARAYLASQEPTDAEVEAVARYFYKTQTGSDLIDTSIYRENWLRIARSALAAGREARHDVP